jgi:hypothetical protein
MLYGSHFNNQLLRKYVVAFGSFFDKITVVRNNTQKLVVPIEYGPKERWLVRLRQDPQFLQGVAQVVPRMSYELTSFSYDATRKLNTLNHLTFPSSTPARNLARTFVGVPYTLTLDLNVLTKYQTDAFQIVEQILPFFTPDLQFAMLTLPTLGLVDQIPLTLTSVSHADNYEGDFEHRRAIVWTLSFDMRVNIYGPVKAQAQITDVEVDLYLGDDFSGDFEPLATETDDTFESEDGLGHLMDEETPDTFITNGRVARIDVQATPPDQIPSENPITTVTVEESIPPTERRNLDGTDEQL